MCPNPQAQSAKSWPALAAEAAPRCRRPGISAQPTKPGFGCLHTRVGVNGGYWHELSSSLLKSHIPKGDASQSQGTVGHAMKGKARDQPNVWRKGHKLKGLEETHRRKNGFTDSTRKRERERETERAPPIFEWLRRKRRQSQRCQPFLNSLNHVQTRFMSIFREPKGNPSHFGGFSI